MSEKLKKQAREFLRKHGRDYPDDELNAMAEFASQVCEQREKEHALDFGELSPEEFNAAQPAYLANFDNHDKQRALTFAGMLVSFRTQPLIERAEAAELALQTLKLAFATNEAALQESQRELAELKRGLRNNNTDFELAFLDAYLDQFRTLKAALQAKEQELPCGHPAANLETISIGSGEFNTFCNFCLQIDNERKEARQQAVADLDPYLKHQPYCVMGSETSEPCSCGLDERIRSLTPPPALTTKNDEFAKKNLAQPSTIFGNVPDKEGPR